MNQKIIKFIQSIYQTKNSIPLHQPSFNGNELKYVTETIKSSFVSSAGVFIDQFEKKIEIFTGSAKAVATVNGTAALHASMYMLGVKPGDFVITQSLTFVATCNAIYHMGAKPIFIDISKKTLSLCPKALENYLDENAMITDEGCIHKDSLKKISAVVPMHTFGHPALLDELNVVCKKWKIPMIEDAAEGLGSFYKNRHVGTIGDVSALSFNGNKIITTGGGGMILCSNLDLGYKTKHVITTAKVSHAYEFYHDEPGFNYRLPNINAALGCAQMELLEDFLKNKRKLAYVYEDFFKDTDYKFFNEPDDAKSNFWLNAIICPDKKSRDCFLEETNKAGINTRPVWQLMHNLPMFKNAICDELKVSSWAEKHLVNLPSTPVNLD